MINVVKFPNERLEVTLSKFDFPLDFPSENYALLLESGEHVFGGCAGGFWGTYFGELFEQHEIFIESLADVQGDLLPIICPYALQLVFYVFHSFLFITNENNTLTFTRFSRLL